MKLAQAHREALRVGSELTRWFRREREPHVENVSVEAVIAVLYREGIDPVLMGAHGINVYRYQARSTQDVDVLVTKRDVLKAIRALRTEFPDLLFFENSAVARLMDPVTKKPLIDIMKPSSTGVQITFRHSVRVGKTHRIPSLEMAIICKYLAMNSPKREMTRRLQDLVDFRDMLEHNRDQVDVAKLKRIGDLLNPRRGSAVAGLAQDIIDGRERPSAFE